MNYKKIINLVAVFFISFAVCIICTTNETRAQYRSDTWRVIRAEQEENTKPTRYVWEGEFAGSIYKTIVSPDDPPVSNTSSPLLGYDLSSGYNYGVGGYFSLLSAPSIFNMYIPTINYKNFPVSFNSDFFGYSSTYPTGFGSYPLGYESNNITSSNFNFGYDASLLRYQYFPKIYPLETIRSIGW